MNTDVTPAATDDDGGNQPITYNAAKWMAALIWTIVAAAAGVIVTAVIATWALASALHAVGEEAKAHTNQVAEKLTSQNKELVKQLDESWQGRVANMLGNVTDGQKRLEDRLERIINNELSAFHVQMGEVKGRLTIMEGHKILPEARERLTKVEAASREHTAALASLTQELQQIKELLGPDLRE